MPKYKTKHVGIGGIRCACCVKGKVSEAKRLVSREQRRKGKEELKKGEIE